MPNTSLYLFEEILPSMTALVQQLEAPHLRSVFAINKTEVQLILTDHSIVLSEARNYRQPTHHCPLAFDTKFEVIYANPVPHLLPRPKNPLDTPPPSNCKEKDVLSNSPSPPIPPLSSPGLFILRKGSIKEAFISCLRPKKR